MCVFSWISINISDRCEVFDIEVFFVLNHPFRGVHFAVYRFTYGQLWSIVVNQKNLVLHFSLLLNHLNVMVHLLVKSTYFIWPESLSNLSSNPLFRRTRWYFTDETLARVHLDSYGSVHIDVQRIRKSKMTLHMEFARLLA